MTEAITKRPDEIYHDPKLNDWAQLTAKNFKETKAGEDFEVLVHTVHIAGDLAKDVTIGHIAGKGVEGALERVGFERAAKAMKSLSKPVEIGIEASRSLKEFFTIFPEQGKREAEAMKRENVNLAMLCVTVDATKGTLPEGYIASSIERVAPGSNGSLPPTPAKMQMQMQKGLDAHDPEHESFRDAFASSVKDGVNDAYSKGVRDEASLEGAQRDKAFARRYEDDAAFREGVRAVLWQAQNRPESYQTAVSDRAHVHACLSAARDRSFA